MMLKMLPNGFIIFLCIIQKMFYNVRIIFGDIRKIVQLIFSDNFFHFFFFCILFMMMPLSKYKVNWCWRHSTKSTGRFYCLIPAQTNKLLSADIFNSSPSSIDWPLFLTTGQYFDSPQCSQIDIIFLPASLCLTGTNISQAYLWDGQSWQVWVIKNAAFPCIAF